MKVYEVYCNEYDDYGTTMATFSTEERARAYADALNLYGYNYDIREHHLDFEPIPLEALTEPEPQWEIRFHDYPTRSTPYSVMRLLPNYDWSTLKRHEHESQAGFQGNHRIVVRAANEEEAKRKGVAEIEPFLEAHKEEIREVNRKYDETLKNYRKQRDAQIARNVEDGSYDF